MLSDGVTELVLRRRECMFPYPSPERWLELFRAYFGPTVAFEALGDDADALAAELLDLARSFNRGGERAMIVPADYAEVVATRA